VALAEIRTSILADKGMVNKGRLNSIWGMEEEEEEEEEVVVVAMGEAAAEAAMQGGADKVDDGRLIR